MTLTLHNTLTRSIEEFVPADPGQVTVYACGPTVYRPPHIGNFRTFIFNDILHRWLEWKDYRVRFVMNLTDVEDKIIDGAAKEGVTIDQITAPMIEAFFADLATLGIRRVDAYPRATAYIPRMVEMVERLVERGHAYVKDGSVYYDISSFADYGKLSRIQLVDTRAGAGLATRAAVVDADEYEKNDARDFALWKAAKDVDRRVGAAWPAPWGDGRPGWHIECSVMSTGELGDTFDIHTGGEDLIFPHHEDEIAQSEGATGERFARVWLHVKHLLVNGEKMSKSKENDFTIAQLLRLGHSPAAIRYLLLQAHYRRELNFSFDGLEDARTALRRLVEFRRRLEATDEAREAPASDLPKLSNQALAAFQASMDDDLNTPNALAALFPFVREVNAALDQAADVVRPDDLAMARETLQRMDDVLGVIGLAHAGALDVDRDFREWVERMLQERQDARGRRDFGAADAIRDELLASGVLVEDTASGPRWTRR